MRVKPCCDHEAQVAELRKKVTTITLSAINLIGAYLCDKHKKDVSEMPFSEFYEREAKLGCEYCREAENASLRAQVAALRDQYSEDRTAWIQILDLEQDDKAKLAAQVAAQQAEIERLRAEPTFEQRLASGEIDDCGIEVEQ
jgi:cell division protein FtsB